MHRECSRCAVAAIVAPHRGVALALATRLHHAIALALASAQRSGCRA